MSRRFGPYIEVFKTMWENRDQLGYAQRILRDGVCDGCALGTSGVRDWTMPDMHLCWIRLNLLRLNTMPALDPEKLSDVENLKSLSEKELRNLGRVPHPMVRRRGEKGFAPLSWDEAIEIMAQKARDTEAKRMAFYLVSRGTTNETYYVAQKVARFLQTNNIDNSARICHSPSTTGLKNAVGYAASTCSYSDFLGTDLMVFFGSDVANNQPVFMKYIHIAKKRGSKVAIVNPYREPGMEKYWVPSTVESALLGTDVADAFFQIKPGGDIAFINGVLKLLIEHKWIDQKFIDEHGVGWDELVQSLAEQSFESLEKDAGVSRDAMMDFARMYGQAKSSILVWSMGITMHRFGVDNVKAIANLGLSRGMVGKPKTGLVPIRGHSGVQGGAEVGAVPNNFPGGVAVSEEGAEKMSELWGFPVPSWKGKYISDIIQQAHRKELDMLYCVGSNLFAVLPDPSYVHQAIKNIPLRIHHDIVVNHQALVDPAETVLLLPATTRYEMAGGNCETTTERRIIFNPEIPGPRIAEARDEWRVLVDLAKKVRPEESEKIDFPDTSAIRKEIAQAVPFYEGIENLAKKGDQVQWGGPLLCAENRFNTTHGKAQFVALTSPQKEVPEGWFNLCSRRGKQFNSMIFGDKDMLLGAKRDRVIMAEEDIKKQKLQVGDNVVVRSGEGELKAVVQKGKITPGTVVMYWPECNIFLKQGDSDERCGMPAYRDALVQVLPG